MAVRTASSSNDTGEPAAERKGLLGDSDTSSAASDLMAETQQQRQAGQKRARSRHWRREEDGLGELLDGGPKSANGGPDRAEAEAAAATTPSSRPRSTFELKIAANAPKGGGFPSSHTPPHVEARAAGGAEISRRAARAARGADISRKVLRALAVLLTVAVLLGLTAVLSERAGVWKWVDVFPYKGSTFDAKKNCRTVHTGPEEPCSNILESTCFDRSRCLGETRGGGGAEGGSLSVYVHDEMCSMRSSSEIFVGKADASKWSSVAGAFRQAAESRGVLVETPAEACIVVYVVTANGACVSQTPTWGKGENHLLVDMNDQTRERRFRLDDRAMFAEANMRPCYFRYGYDIAIPLPAKTVFHSMRDTAPQDRKYFATFKGSLYLSGNGLLERTAVRNLGDAAAKDPRVVVVERCQTRHKEHLQSRNVELCESLQREYDKTGYGDLMNTTFALVPSGRSPATYRLGEALSAGAIPVFIHQNFVKPFPGKIPWSTFSFSFPAEESSRIIDTLRAVSAEKLVKMQETALEVFDSYFGREMNGTVHTTLDILEERLSFRG